MTTEIICAVWFCTLCVFSVVLALLFFDNHLKSKNLKNNLKMLDLKAEEIKDENVKFNFETDIQFLHFIIDQQLTTTKEYYIKPLQSSNTTIKINDSNFNEIYENLIVGIINMLSPDYYNMLMKYFTPDSLIQFITDTVFTDLLKTCVEINFNNLNKNKIMENIRKTTEEIKNED